MASAMIFSAPRWAPTAWLLRTGDDVPAEIRRALVGSLYGTLPIYAGGVINTIGVALLATLRHPTPAFLCWLMTEVLLCATRLFVLLHDRRAARDGRRTFTDLYIGLGLSWAASVGYGAYITMTSGDWVSATLACLSAAAMVGGICFRNFAAPRLVAAMILLSLGPCVVGAIVSREAMLLIVVAQIPFYLVSMTIAAFKLNRMLVTTMQAERDNERRARHDPLTGLANRTGLQHAFDARRADGGQAIFYLDLNGFKAVNDRLGHAAGDQLLVAVADRLRALDWPDLFVSRVGGDEFVLIAPMLEEAVARRLSEAIVATISDDLYPIENVRVPIGVSVGVAFARAGDELRTIMSSADKALYASKSASARPTRAA
ncbi:GGDEF domain-containing protein [Sphingomonas quercus]|uniref:GGDEF domain-containing protein n=1 Tax=Sphingomonas quercus TaxID=2842451 RepID=A0ABS6BF82_9SPHN|nr:GGDEF domain-containing protein [Sphingomonas quercus]